MCINVVQKRAFSRLANKGDHIEHPFLYWQNKNNERFVNSQEKSKKTIDNLTILDYYIDKVKESQSQKGDGEKWQQV